VDSDQDDGEKEENLEEVGTQADVGIVLSIAVGRRRKGEEGRRQQ
jgi:hypothetical protein